MCYGVYLSTDCDEDLTQRNSDLVRFEKLADAEADPCISLLQFSGRWYVGSKSGCSCTFRHLVSTELGFTEPVDWYVGSKAGCSCTFRHLASTELGFSEPVDWYGEEQDEIHATGELCSVLRTLVEAGHQVDLVDRWEGAQPETITSVEVSLGEVSDREFRLFENHRFRLRGARSAGSQG